MDVSHTATTTGGPAPDVAEVDRICAIGNRVIRNLEITACYARLSNAFRGRTGGWADWCTFATWASRQAGSTIRGEDLLDRVKRRLLRKGRLLAPLQAVNRALLRKGLFEPQTRLGRVVAAIHTPFDAFERASDAVARGNLTVFAEIGREFARFLHTVPADAAVDSPAVRTFLNGLRPGPPPDGQEYLRQAFAHYQAHAAERDPQSRAALLLLANLKIGLHEQTRLQGQIAAAVDAPLMTAADLGRRALHALFRGSPRWPPLAQRPAAALLGWMALPVRRASIRLTREVVTEALMTLALPGAVLALGRDLEAPVPQVFAANPNPELAAFVAGYDPCSPGECHCAATDWCDLSQRMHYILHLFRAYADDAALFAAPLSQAELDQIRAGAVPDTDL